MVQDKADTEAKMESEVKDPSPSPNLNPEPEPQPDPKPENRAPKGDSETATLASKPDSEPPVQESNLMSPASRKSVPWSPELVSEPSSSPTDGSNPSIAGSPAENPASSNSFKDTMETVKGVLGRWGRKVGEATRKAEDLAGNTWQHLKTAPSFADAAMGRIAQGTKVLAEGGYEKIFRQTFETVPEEQLQNSYACYLSTSAGPVMGTLYISTAKLAYCSDNPLSYKTGNETEWSYYKVVIPLHQLKALNPSTSRVNSSEKYIQVISVDNHEFWFMGFLNYDGAVKSLQDNLQPGMLPSA